MITIMSKNINKSDNCVVLSYQDFGKLTKEVIELCISIDNVEYNQTIADENYPHKVRRLEEIGRLLHEENGTESMLEITK